MKRILSYLPIVVFGLIVWGCLEEIDLRVEPEFQDNVVIQGSLVLGNPSRVNVRVTKLFDFTSNGREALSVRSVILFDEDGNQVELEVAGAVGDYAVEIPVNDPRMSIGADKRYYIEVSTFDGRTFRSEEERIPNVPEATELQARLTEVEQVGADGELRQVEYVEFLLSTPLDNGENDGTFLRWVAERTYRSTDEGMSDAYPEPKTCYVTESSVVSNLPVGSTEEFSGSITAFPVYQEPINHRFAEGYYVSIFQQGLTRGAYGYWSGIASLINREGTIFEPPVGQVPSNISNIEDPDDRAFGYFYATQQDTIRMYISPDFVGNPEKYCPVEFGMVNQNFVYCEAVPICCDCLSVPRSQLERPSFWVE